MDQTINRILSFYLPQFHPIPENDQWWGKGFTEWTNVARSVPLFPGHYQPHIPADLGFYDLRLPETMKSQAKLAKANGIEGFCYWHYWFNGKRLLERPVNDLLASSEPDFPFCLAWANETWSRRWLGEENSILIKQDYSDNDDQAHCRWLVKAFSDKRYILVKNRPLFLIYRPKHLPNPMKFTATLRKECIAQGIPDPYLVGIDAHCPNFDCRDIGFDLTLKFEPQLGCLPASLKETSRFGKFQSFFSRTANHNLKIFDYQEARHLMTKEKPDHPYIPCVFVRWDNTPRRGKDGIVICNSTPEKFKAGLKDAIKIVEEKAPEEKLIFVNAWNEWAEGNHLEPDFQFGKQYLEAIKQLNYCHIS